MFRKTDAVLLTDSFKIWPNLLPLSLLCEERPSAQDQGAAKEIWKKISKTILGMKSFNSEKKSSKNEEMC